MLIWLLVRRDIYYSPVGCWRKGTAIQAFYSTKAKKLSASGHFPDEILIVWS